MSALNPKKYAYFDEATQKFYAAEFWIKLMAILDPQKSEEFKKDYADRVPLDVMVDYTQKNFLRKVGQRWVLENYASFEKNTKEKLDVLLQKYGQLTAQPFPEKTEFALFLGGSIANLCKRAFYLYEAIVVGASITHVIVLGNTEPYDAYLGGLRTIITTHPDYFCKGFSAAQVPEHATMHEVMIFILENLKWPQGKKPSIIELDIPHPSNTNHEASAVVKYLINKTHATEKNCVVALSNQPFDDRQGITFLGEFMTVDLSRAFTLVAAGPGVDTYPLLNKMPASIMSSAQIVDNLTRTLYEVSCKANVLLKSSKPESVSAFAKASSNIDDLVTLSETKLDLFKSQLKNNEVEAEAEKKEKFEKYATFFEANRRAPEIAKTNFRPQWRQSLFTNEGRLILVESGDSNPEDIIDVKPVFP